MNAHSRINEADEAAHNTGDGSSRFRVYWEDQFARPFRELKPWQKWAWAAGVVAVTALVIFGIVTSVNQMPTKSAVQTKAPATTTQKVATPASVSATALNPDSATLAQQGISLLKSAYEQVLKHQVDQSTMLNAHTGEIKLIKEELVAIKTRTQTDPKVTKGFQDDLDAIKKLMAVPPVKLTPMSVLDSKTPTS